MTDGTTLLSPTDEVQNFSADFTEPKLIFEDSVETGTPIAWKEPAIDLRSIPTVNLAKELSIVQILEDHSVVLDREAMTVGMPYPFWLGNIFLIAVKHADRVVEFFSLPEPK